jgi:hypothetical protein
VANETFPQSNSELPKEKDVALSQELKLEKQTQDSINSIPKKKSRKRKAFLPLIKSMGEITVEDYKILHYDGTEESVDTSLSIEGEYRFNFLREDYFEYLPLPNMGEGFNRLGYDFQKMPLTPQMGMRVKHFGYFEKEDVRYYEVPTPYTELFFKSTFEQGQHLDATLAINTSPKFNVAVSFRGFRSLGKYVSSLSRSRQFRMSTQYQNYNLRYRLRLHQTTQSIENEVNGGLNNDSVYFFENAPNYVVADQNGEPVLDENGEQQFQFYDGFLDRSLLTTQIQANNELSGKSYFMEHRYQMLPIAKDTTVYKMAVGIRTHYEKKKYLFNLNRVNRYLYETFDVSGVEDSTDFATFENNLFVSYDDPGLGKFNLDFFQYNWVYELGENEYEKDTLLPNKIDARQLAVQAQWNKSIYGFYTHLQAYQSFNKEYATSSLEASIQRSLIKDFSFFAKYQYRSQPLNFNYYLTQSDFKEYNWNLPELGNPTFSTRSLGIFHSKWGSVKGEWTQIDHYTYFNNSTPLTELNKKFKVEVRQFDRQIDYLKVRFDQRLDFGKFSWINNAQYQKVRYEENPDPDEVLSGPLGLNVPEWLVRSTFMLTSSLFNKALFFQSGATFVFFTDYYADQYNPLIAEFVTQNNQKIGEYPRVDFFFNAKIKSSRLYFKLENVSAPIEHLIKVDTPYDYYSAPYTPYRDFSVRFGLIWNFFE